MVAINSACEITCPGERYSNSLLASVPEHVLRLSADGVILEAYIADSINFAVPSDDLVGKHLDDVFPADVVEQYRLHIEACLKNGRIQAFEYKCTIQYHKG